MRILHLFDWYLPSTLSWVSRLLDHLSAGAEIQIGAPWIVQNQFYNPRFRFFTFPPQRWLFPKITHEWQFSSGQKWFARTQRRLPLYPFWLEKQLRRDPPDVLHAHFGPTGCLYLPLAKKLDRPLVVTFYGFDYQKILRRRPVFREKYRALFAAAAAVIAASPTGCRALETLGCPPDKLAVVRPAPELVRFPFSQRKKTPGRLDLVQAATFTPKKGHLTTLEAFRLVLPDCPDLRLTLAGEKYDARLVRQIRGFINQYGLEKHIKWLDFVPHDGMASFLTGFDAFIHPSQTAPDGDHEATPVALLEAQATGLPVLATTHFDLPDEVAHAHGGLLVPEGDAQGLAGAIRRFYAMENEEYQQFSRNAREQVVAHFEVGQSAASLLALYTRMLKSPYS